jgi:anti-anti-sigma regulatory factor
MNDASDVSVANNGDDNSVVITGSGILDLTNTDKLRRVLEDAAASKQEVTVDFRAAVFIDSAVLQYLGSAGRRMLKDDRRLKVMVIEDSHPHYVLTTVGFSALMSIEAEPASK